MDEKQIEALAERIFLKLREELGQQTAAYHSENVKKENMPQAYIILPEQMNQKITDRVTECLESCCGEYRTVVVTPDSDGLIDSIIREKADSVIRRCEASSVTAGYDSLTVFVAASRNLRVRTALCLAVDFESRWVIDCIERDRPVYMLREDNRTGKEPATYLQKIADYDRQLKAYGVIFDIMPVGRQEGKKWKTRPSGSMEKRRVITTEDIKNLGRKCLELEPRDIITEMGREKAREMGIKIIE